jgi:hypothetical protein
MITADDVRREIAGMQDSIAQEIAEHPEEGPISPYMMPVFEAGHWLSKRIEELGATEKESEDASFALGQRVRMAGTHRAYEVAAECFNRWVDGHKDEPGRKLALQLIDGTVQP